MHAPPRALAALVLIAVAVGCTPTPQTTPGPVPSLTCLGTGGSPSPFPCDDATRTAEQRALEQQARVVYERYWKEYTRLLEAGGATEATPELSATVAQPMLSNVVSLLRFQKDKGWVPKPFVAKYTLQMRSAPAREGAEVSVIACEDTTGSVLYDPSGQRAGQGSLSVQVRALKRVEGALKIYDGEGQAAGSPCPID